MYKITMKYCSLQVYEKYFVSKPGRSCAAVSELPKGVPGEVEAVALIK